MYEQHESYNSLQCLDGRYFSEIVVSMTVSVFFLMLHTRQSLCDGVRMTYIYLFMMISMLFSLYSPPEFMVDGNTIPLN